MALNPIVSDEQFAELNEAVQAEYESQEDGSYLLNVNKTEDGWELANTKNLLSSKRAETSARKALEKMYKPFDGLDAEQVSNALSFQADFDEKNINLKEETDKRVATMKGQLVKEFAEKESGYKSEINNLFSEVKKDKIDNRLRTMLIPHVNEASDIDLLLPQFKNRMDVIKNDDGKLESIVLDEFGEKLETSSNEKDAALKVLMKEMKGKHPRWFKSDSPSGTGSGNAKTGTTTSGANTMKRSDFDKLDQGKQRNFLTKDGKSTGNTIVD